MKDGTKLNANIAGNGLVKASGQRYMTIGIQVGKVLLIQEWGGESCGSNVARKFSETGSVWIHESYFNTGLT